MSMALYRVYRPQKFSEVAGQSAAVGVLEKELLSGRTAHAYLFSGARGCGKTTAARLLAKALNCTNIVDGYEPCCACTSCVGIAKGESLDVIEIDGASNNGVDEIRELKTHVALAPFSSRFKVYIIDEVHMLSTAAFNALLKTLEEPPHYVVFILATTEPHKVPVTIRSRCQHIPFHRISPQDINARLKTVCEHEKLEFDDEALWEISRASDGALRDALSLLDQVASLGKGKISLGDVENLMGGGSRAALERWLSAWREGGENSFSLLDEMFQRGASPQRTLEELFSLARNLFVARTWGADKLNDISTAEREYLAREGNAWDVKSLERLMMFLSKLIPSARVGMRTDILVGIMMSRRGEIIDLPPSPSAPPPSKREAKAPAPQAVAPAPLPPIEILPDMKPISNWDEFLARAMSEKFALYCALLGASGSENDEQKIACISVADEYIFHALSGGKNPAVLATIMKEFLPEHRIVIKCGSLSHECTAKQKPSAQSLLLRRAEQDEPEKVEKPEKNGKNSTVQGALKYMRGEVVLHRVADETTDIPEAEEVE